MSEDQNTDVPPNHLSIDPRSAFYSEEVLRRDVGIPLQWRREEQCSRIQRVRGLGAC